MSDETQSVVARVLGQIPSGVSILTARLGNRSTGMLASWVQQAAFEPPSITVAVKNGRPISPLIESSGSFVLNLMGEDRTALFKHFGKGFGPDDPAFTGLAVREVPEGIVVDACIAHLRCRLIGSLDVGDHRIYAGEVAIGEVTAEARPYVHLRANGLRY